MRGGKSFARARTQKRKKPKKMMTARRMRMLFAMAGIEFPLKPAAATVIVQPPAVAKPPPTPPSVLRFDKNLYNYGRETLHIIWSEWNFTKGFPVPREYTETYEAVYQKFTSFCAKFEDVAIAIADSQMPLEDVLRNTRLPEEKKAALRAYASGVPASASNLGVGLSLFLSNAENTSHSFGRIRLCPLRSVLLVRRVLRFEVLVRYRDKVRSTIGNRCVGVLAPTQAKHCYSER
jgi:hypothetical protein